MESSEVRFQFSAQAALRGWFHVNRWPRQFHLTHRAQSPYICVELCTTQASFGLAGTSLRLFACGIVTMLALGALTSCLQKKRGNKVNWARGRSDFNVVLVANCGFKLDQPKGPRSKWLISVALCRGQRHQICRLNRSLLCNEADWLLSNRARTFNGSRAHKTCTPPAGKCRFQVSTFRDARSLRTTGANQVAFGDGSRDFGLTFGFQSCLGP